MNYAQELGHWGITPGVLASSIVCSFVWFPPTCPGSARGSHRLGGCSYVPFSQRCFGSSPPSNPGLSLAECEGLFTSVMSLRHLTPELLVLGTGLDQGRHSTNTALNDVPSNLSAYMVARNRKNRTHRAPASANTSQASQDST